MEKFFTSFITPLILVGFNPLFSQTQIGNDIYAESPGDRFGASVSLSSDGSRIATGATSNTGSGSLSGHVRVHEWNGTGWVQLGSDIDGEAANDRFGTSTSLSADGNRVAVGARFNDGNGDDAGHVRVFEWDGGNWAQLGADIDGEAGGDYSGSSVSLSADGNMVAIGAPQNTGAEVFQGHVRVFEWDGSDWVQVGTDIDGVAGGDNLGGAVSLSSNGTRLAVGARRHQKNGTWSGQVQIYRLLGNTWVQLGDDIYGDSQYDFFGTSVSLSSDGSMIAIGATQDEVNGFGNGPGYVRTFEWDGTGWVQLGSDIVGEAISDQFGFAVSLSQDGSKLIAGARFNDGNGMNAGHARIYEWNGGDWEQIGADIDGEAGEDFCGFSVSLSPDGSRIAVGATENDGGGFDGGQVRVFEAFTVPVHEINSERNFDIYPNPTIGLIQIIGGDYESVRVTDSFGKVLLIENKYKPEVDISDLPSGVYFVLISSDKRLITQKLIKY